MTKKDPRKLIEYVAKAVVGTLPDLYDYEDRKVLQYDSEGLFVSTAWVSDCEWYETAIAHPDYYNGDLIVVEQYGDDRDAAQVGHARWLERMVTEPLPECLKDIVKEAYGIPSDQCSYERDRDDLAS